MSKQDKSINKVSNKKINKTINKTIDKMIKKTNITCAGFVILTRDNNQTILVKTHMGNLSFPKGKIKKGEKYLDAAFRELEEETGLIEDNIDIIEDLYFDELSQKGFPSTRYFVAYIKDIEHKFKFDLDELCDVEWYACNEVANLDKIKKARKAILVEILDMLN